MPGAKDPLSGADDFRHGLLGPAGMRPVTRRVRGLLARTALSLALFVVLLEGTLCALRPFNESVRSWLAVPQDAVDFGSARTTAELLDRSELGFRPFVDQRGFVTNSRGFRTEEYSREKPPGTWRLVALGDSFTFASGGVPWPDLWTTRLRERLQRATTRPVELVNLGEPAVGPSFELRVWQLEAAALEPDLVLLGLFVGNDFSDERVSADEGFFARYGRASCALRLLRNLVRGLDPERPGGPGANAPQPRPVPLPRGGHPVAGYERSFAERGPSYSEAKLVEIATRSMKVCDRRRGQEFEQRFGRVARALRQLHAEVAAAGARLAVVVIPFREQVDPADRAIALAAAGRPDDDFDWDAPQRRLAELLQGEGIPFLDLLPALRAAAPVRELYSRGDTHWSPEGNELAARLVAEWFEAQGWPPGSAAR